MPTKSVSVHRKEQANEVTVVAVGDIHAGSNSAVMPSRFTLESGVTVEGNIAQQSLYEKWHSLAKEWHAPDIMIVNGDAIEGQARKESGVPCWSNNLDDQVNCAAALIREFSPKSLYVINGTGYHVDSGGKPLEGHLGEKLKAVQFTPGVFSGEELFLKVGNYTFHASHHISVGTGWYKTTPLARELVFALLNESDKYRADVFLRSHVHYFAGVEFNRQMGYLLPCWQLQTRYMIRKSAFGMLPSIGALRFHVGTDGIAMEKRFYKIPEAKPRMFIYAKRNAKRNKG